MSINFENKEARTEYLNQKLDNLLSGINSTYCQALLDELIVRLTRTISDFNEEVEKIMGNLKDNSDKKSKIIHELMEGKEIEGSSVKSNKDIEGQENADKQEDGAPEMSEWEKRLEGIK